ncbi:MAG: DUF86 domain-containing protein [Kiritimatiellaeota bacterium]|nr:DUF86 domain-containing protein [Kiritimatiellota bacterium]
MPPDPDLVRLFHIWEAAREAMDHTEGRSRADLDTDRLLQHALVRLLEIVGEGAAGCSPAFRSDHPQIPWKAMVGMRNRLIHA